MRAIDESLPAASRPWPLRNADWVNPTAEDLFCLVPPSRAEGRRDGDSTWSGRTCHIEGDVPFIYSKSTGTNRDISQCDWGGQKRRRSLSLERVDTCQI
jgi:hypothetical protein